MTPLTSISDVRAALLRDLTPTENTLADILIVKASALVRQAAPWVDARIAMWNPLAATHDQHQQAIDPVNVATVVAEIVARPMRNPNGYATVTRTLGSVSVAYGYGRVGDPSRTIDLRVTADDIDAIDGKPLGQRTETPYIGTITTPSTFGSGLWM